MKFTMRSAYVCNLWPDEQTSVYFYNIFARDPFITSARVPYYYVFMLHYDDAVGFVVIRYAEGGGLPWSFAARQNVGNSRFHRVALAIDSWQNTPENYRGRRRCSRDELKTRKVTVRLIRSRWIICGHLQSDGAKLFYNTFRQRNYNIFMKRRKTDEINPKPMPNWSGIQRVQRAGAPWYCVELENPPRLSLDFEMAR